MSERPHFAIEKCGPTAARRLAREADGRIAAVFPSTIYVELGSGLIAIGTRALAMGPLNAASSAATTTDWQRAGLCVGQRATLRAGRLDIGGAPSFDASSLEVWRPPRPAGSCKTAALRQSLRIYGDLAAELAPAEGFGPLFRRAASLGLSGAVIGKAAPLIAAMEDWLRAEPAEAPPPGTAVDGLLGLGPGLTPSGDDYLAGVMIALQGLGMTAALDRLSVAVLRAAPARTTEISRAHLSAAAQGLGSEALHGLFDALLAGRTDHLLEALRAVDSVGHSSGWDGAAGLLSVLRSWLSARRFSDSAVTIA